MNGIPTKPHLRFGIPSLDDLFGSYSLSHRADGIPVSTSKEQARLTITGPAGSGKSILALHLASRYAADVFTRTGGKPPRVIYISTDLTLEKANAMWNAFRLDRPNLREVPFYRSTSTSTAQQPVPQAHVALKVVLKELCASGEPADDKSLARFLRRPTGATENGIPALGAPNNADGSGAGDVVAVKDGIASHCMKIGFLDLLTTPVGDAWTFTSRLLAALDSKAPGKDRKDGETAQPLMEGGGDDNHDQPLIFVDNVDGFEAEVGEVNAFGEPSSLRARIMQTLKAARHNAHLVFLSEEQGLGTSTLAEESDVVVRLRLKELSGYRYRTIEVQKARAQAIHRGDHALIFRTGSGSTTGIQENADDPRTCNAYVLVMPSLHTVSRRVMNEPTELRSPDWAGRSRRAGFGLRYLDGLCGGLPIYADDDLNTLLKNDRNGLQYGTLTGIIGDSNTYKSPLAQKFLLRPFELFAESLDQLFRDDPSCGYGTRADSLVALTRIYRAIESARPRKTDGYNSDGKLTLSQQFKALDTLEKKAEFLADIILYGRTGLDDIWTHEVAAKKLICGELPEDLLLLCGWWAARLLVNRIGGLFEPGFYSEEKVTVLFDELGHCTGIDDPLSCRKLLDLVRERKSVPWEDVVNIAVDRWLFGRSVENGKDLLAQYEFEKESPLNCAANIVHKVREVTQDFGRSSTHVTDVRKAIHTDWSRLLPFDLLRLHLPGSLDYLTSEHLARLKEDLAQPLDSDAACRLLAGLVVAWIKAQVRGSSEILVSGKRETPLYTWLKTVPCLESLIPISQVTLEKFGLAILQCHAKVASRAEQESLKQSMDRRFATMNEMRKGKDPDPDWATVLPQVVFAGDPAGQGLSVDEFAHWLFEMSSKTHPYACQEGEKALSREIKALETKPRQEQDRLYPVFCSAIVAAVLELVRDHRLGLKGHIEDELHARREAAESLEKLSIWLECHVEPVHAHCDRPDSIDCAGVARTLVDAAIQKGLDASLRRECRDEISKCRRLYFKTIAPNRPVLTEVEDRLQFGRLVLEAAARVGLLDGPTLLITTKDVRLETLREQYSNWLGRYLCNKHYDTQKYHAFAQVVLDHLSQWLVVRRLEAHFLDSAVLAGIIRLNVEACQSVIFAAVAPHKVSGPADSDSDQSEHWTTNINVRRRLSMGIRLAVDGLAALKQTYPNVLMDPLFLPTFKFYVSRENLTAIVVASQKGSPDETGEDRFERDTVDVFLNQIRIWRVLFFGELRVALSVVPPAPGRGTAHVRELTMRSDGELEIAPHFELYKNLERGSPEAVALEVRLSGETKMLPAYQQQLDSVLAQTFPVTGATNRSQVVRADLAGGWSAQLRDFGRLHRESHLDYTLLLQIDEYWSFGRSDAFRRQATYLQSKCTDEPHLHRTDPLEVFQRTLADLPDDGEQTRYKRFHWESYSPQSKEPHRRQQEHEQTDRIPFMWDFGFLLCDQYAWNGAKDLKLSIAEDRYHESITVGEVWESLKKVSGKDAKAAARHGEKQTDCEGEAPEGKEADQCTKGIRVPFSSWRVVLEAAVEVAARKTMGGASRAPALDLTMVRGESLVCLILEIWASEVYRKYLDRKTPADLMKPYFEHFTRRSWLRSRTHGIIGMIAEPAGRGASLKQIYTKALAQGKLPDLLRHSLELYKVMILLREAFDADSIASDTDWFQFQSRPVSPDAVCARHWYTTACEFLEGQPDAERYQAVRLPGHFSLRGDSYLAVASGSQSSLLADRALDLLSSRRGNHERLRLGLGLPVRDVATDEAGPEMRTRLPMVDSLGRRTWVGYQELKDIGSDPKHPVWNQDGFHWLWRSTLGDYDAHARALTAGIHRIMDWWKDLRVLRSPGWKSGFHLYDAIDLYYSAPDEVERRKIFKDNFEVFSLWEFPEICDELVDRLRHATPRSR